MKYYAYCQGPSGFRKLETINTSIYSILDNTALDKDWYQSVYLYDDEHLEEYKTKKTLAGITGVVTNRLVFDFDSKANIEHAKSDAIEAYTRLVMHGIPEKCILICFSGMKGFSIEFKIDKLLTVEESRSIAEALMKGIKTFDPVIYDAQRIFRVPLSKHNKSGLYKIPLMRDQLESLTIEEILEEAKTTDGIDPDSLVLDTCPLPSGIYEMRNKEAAKKSAAVDPVSDLKEAVKRIDFSMKPKYLNKIKYVAQEGYFEEGDRSNLLMALGATYKAQGFNKAMVYRMLKGVAQNQADVMGAERFEDEKVWNTIIKPLFEGDKWNGGTYGMDHPAIKKYAEKIGMEVDTTENKPLTIFEASDDFELYIENLEANTIKIGIPDLDDAAPLTTGTNVMILGGPGSGKTSMALEILENTSKQGITSVVASLDMHRNRLLEKLYLRISGLGRKDLHDVFKNPARQAQKEKLRMLLKENYANVYFYDRSSPTVQDVREYIEQIKDKDAKQVKLVLVDYFERISCDLSDDTASSKRVASQLQDLCNDLNVCLITLVQPNKMSGDASEPIYSYTNIKGSSYLGQSARIIFSIWRPFFSAKHSEHDNFISIALLKNDLGELSQFDYRWHGRTGKISPLTDEQRGELSRLLDAMEASEEDDKREKARW